MCFRLELSQWSVLSFKLVSRFAIEVEDFPFNRVCCSCLTIVVEVEIAERSFN